MARCQAGQGRLSFRLALVEFRVDTIAAGLSPVNGAGNGLRGARPARGTAVEPVRIFVERHRPDRCDGRGLINENSIDTIRGGGCERADARKVLRWLPWCTDHPDAAAIQRNLGA